MIEIKNLNKSFGKERILKDINLHIKEGEFVVLKGVSGSGKSTLLSIIAGMSKPTSGEILLQNEPIAKLPDIHISHFRAKKIGIVFQNFNLIENLSVLDNTIAPLVALKIGYKEAKQKALKALDEANISHQAQKLVNTLSGGEKQRVAIARAIVTKPKVLLCDEPTANLDRKNSLNLILKLEELNSKGVTVIVATHDPIFENIKKEYRVVNINKGVIVE